MFLASESWLYQTSTNWFWYWPTLIFKLDFLRSCRLGFSHQRVNWELYNCKGGFRREVCLLILALGFWCPRTHWRFCFESPRSSNSCFSLVDFVLFHRGLNRKNSILGKLFGWRDVDFFPFKSNPVGLKFPNGAMIFDLPRYSNSFFSKNLGSICRIEIPQEIFGVVTNQSIKKWSVSSPEWESWWTKFQLLIFRLT